MIDCCDILKNVHNNLACVVCKLLVQTISMTMTIRKNLLVQVPVIIRLYYYIQATELTQRMKWKSAFKIKWELKSGAALVLFIVNLIPRLYLHMQKLHV